MHGEKRESHKKEWIEKNFQNLEEVYNSFKKQCASKTVVLTEDEGQNSEQSQYFAYFTWDDFVELAYSNHVRRYLPATL